MTSPRPSAVAATACISCACVRACVCVCSRFRLSITRGVRVSITRRDISCWPRLPHCGRPLDGSSTSSPSPVGRLLALSLFYFYFLFLSLSLSLSLFLCCSFFRLSLFYSCVCVFFDRPSLFFCSEFSSRVLFFFHSRRPRLFFFSIFVGCFFFSFIFVGGCCGGWRFALVAAQRGHRRSFTSTIVRSARIALELPSFYIYIFFFAFLS